LRGVRASAQALKFWSAACSAEGIGNLVPVLDGGDFMMNAMAEGGWGQFGNIRVVGGGRFFSSAITFVEFFRPQRSLLSKSA